MSTASMTNAAGSGRKGPARKSGGKKKRKATLKVRLQDIVADMVKKGIHLDEAHEHLERQFLIEVLDVCGGNQCRAAKKLHVHRNTLRRKLERHGLR